MAIFETKYSKYLNYYLFFISLCVLSVEFFFDLKKDLLLYRLVLLLDWILLSSYFVIILVKILANLYRIVDYLKESKADVAFNLVLMLSLLTPRLAAGLVIIRLCLNFFMRILKTKLGTKLVAQLNLKPSQTMALSFIGIITLGTILLTFPAATKDGQGASLINALFTATSAACVTGLSVYDIGPFFTLFGQAVILCCIQVGGLGIMVLSAAFSVMLGARISSRRQVGLREVLDVSTPEGLRNIIRYVFATTIIMESLGALSLFFLWIKDIPNSTERLWWAVFHAISAFCNCGYGLAVNSFEDYVDNPFVCSVIMILITVGGLGFFVISDLSDPEVWRVKRLKAIWNRLEIQTRVVILMSLLLNIFGMLLFLYFEYDGALKGLSTESKILASLFQTVVLRTAGFFTVPMGQLAAPTVMFCVVWMFIGGSPQSTAGGIKTTTTAISLMTIRSMLRGREHVEMMGRTIPPVIVNRSLSILLIAGFIVVFFLMLMLATQELPFTNLLFETISAFSTVGLSMDTSPLLNDFGKILIVCVMYIGRIGPLTLALAIGEKKLSQGYFLPQGRLVVG